VFKTLLKANLLTTLELARLNIVWHYWTCMNKTVSLLEIESFLSYTLFLQISGVNKGYLSGNDMMFLYEAAGILVVASLSPPEEKGALMTQLLNPLVQKFPIYLNELSTKQKASEQEVLVHVLCNILSFARLVTVW
jgi:hypothetical protein